MSNYVVFIVKKTNIEVEASSREAAVETALDKLNNVEPLKIEENDIEYIFEGMLPTQET